MPNSYLPLLSTHKLTFTCFILMNILVALSGYAKCQESSLPTDSVEVEALQLIFPEQENWNYINEGDTIMFRVKSIGGAGKKYLFNLSGNESKDINFDSSGLFVWSPDFDFVDRLEEKKMVQLLFEVSDSAGHSANQQVDFYVNHINRPPVIGEMKNLYIKYNAENTYQVNLNTVTDPDNDPVIFKPIPYQMPEGAKLSEKGEFKWKPSLRQFRRLQNNPIVMSFIVEDQPHKATVKGQFNVLATQMDLPPEILVTPSTKKFSIDEDETVNLKFFLSDPNGDDDIYNFDFTTDDSRVGEETLVQNSQTQYEFIWTPGYSFVKEPGDSIKVELNFLVVDKSYQKLQEKFIVTVYDTENQVEKDKLLFNQYKAGLLRAWELIEQLEEKEKEIRKELKSAKKGKKRRAIASASLGAITGLSPVFLEEQPQTIVSGVGGTTTLTLGTLEATNVIGKSPSDMMERLNKIINKKNELKILGDIFARKYALRLSRREDEFDKDLNKLVAALNLTNPAALDLDAGWKSNNKPTDENIKDTFKDFNAQLN